MSESKLVFGRDKSKPAWGLALSSFLGLLLVAWSLYFTLLGVEAEYSIGLPAACLVACIVWAVVSFRRLRDQEPKLIIDDRGITDYRADNGQRFVAWGTILNMEYQFKTKTESINFIALPTKTRAQIIAYCQESNTNDVQAINIDIAGLERRPSDVRTEANKAWTRYKLQRGEV